MGIREEIAEQQNKLKTMTAKERRNYIWYYYRYHIIIGVLSVALIIYLAVDLVLALRPYAVYAVATNTSVPYMNSDFEDGYAEYAGIDTDTYQIGFDYSNDFIQDGLDYPSTSIIMQIKTMATDGQLDILICSESDLVYFANDGILSEDVTSLLPEDILNAVEDNLFYYKFDDGVVACLGFYIDDAPGFQKIGLYANDTEQRHVLTVLPNAPQPENAAQFIRYIYEEP